MTRKPRVITRCVANAYADADERIVEFSFPSERDSAGCPKGGLICFRVATTPDGVRVPRVEVYRTDGEVLVIAPEKQPCSVLSEHTDSEPLLRLASAALGRLRDDDATSRPDAIELLRRALNLNADFEEAAP